MSRSARAAAAASGHDRVRRVLRAGWYAACTVLGHGCFYVLPLPEVVVNEPPDIYQPELDPQPIEVRSDTLVLSTIAADPEDEPVFCEWPDLDNLEATTDRYPSGDVWVCRAEITDLSGLQDGDVLRATVFDGHHDNVVTVRWEVRFP
jgi:hypothetical protein